MTVSLNHRRGHIFAQPSQVLARHTPVSGVCSAISAKPSTAMISDRGTTLPARRLLTQTWLGSDFAAKREFFLHLAGNRSVFQSVCKCMFQPPQASGGLIIGSGHQIAFV